MVLTLGIHSRMGIARGPNVIGVCLSPLQGGGSVCCLFHSGEGVWGLHPEGLGGNCKSQNGQGGTRGEGKKRGGFCLFRFSLWNESWNEVFERLAWLFFFILFYKEGVLDWEWQGGHVCWGSTWEGWAVAHLYAHTQSVSSQVCTCGRLPPPIGSIPLSQCVQSRY